MKEMVFSGFRVGLCRLNCSVTILAPLFLLEDDLVWFCSSVVLRAA